MDSFFDSIRQHVSDRMTSPLGGAIFISWCGWNYKFIVILISGMSPVEKFNLIGAVLFVQPSDYFLQGLLYPVVTALLYIFVYPFPARFIYEFSLSQKRKLKETMQKSYNETPMTLEDSRHIRLEHRSEITKLESDIDQKESHVKRLKAVIQDFRAKDESAQLELKTLDEQYQMLKNSHAQNTSEKNYLQDQIDRFVKSVNIDENAYYKLPGELVDALKQISQLSSPEGAIKTQGGSHGNGTLKLLNNISSRIRDYAAGQGLELSESVVEEYFSNFSSKDKNKIKKLIQGPSAKFASDDPVLRLVLKLMGDDSSSIA